MLKLPHASYRRTQFSLTAELVSPVSTHIITMKDEDFSTTVDLQLAAVVEHTSGNAGVLLLLPAAELAPLEGRNLVDSASSHTLVSKIKPCMSEYKRFIL